MLVSTLPKKVTKIKVPLLIGSSLLLFVLLNTLLTLLVVNSSLIRIWKNFISISNFLKLFLCFIGVFSVLIWVMLNGQFFESLLNLIFVCVPLNPHYIVIVISWVRRFLLLLILSLASTLLISSIKSLLTSIKVEFKLLSSNTRKSKARIIYSKNVFRDKCCCKSKDCSKIFDFVSSICLLHQNFVK